MLAYSHSEDSAITGGAFYSGTLQQFPAAVRGSLLLLAIHRRTHPLFRPGEPRRSDDVRHGDFLPDEYRNRRPTDRCTTSSAVPARAGPRASARARSSKFNTPPPIAPQIVSHPSNSLVSVGYDASFTVSVAGTPPLEYQWQRHNGVEFVDIPGATASTLMPQ